MKYRKCSGFITLLLVCAVLMFMLCGCGGKSSRVTKETGETVFGIDAAKYQGTIDWQQVAGAGIDFAMIRVGYRSNGDGAITADTNARYNLQEATSAGIPVGVYFFSTAVSEEEAREEAAWVAEFVSQYPITYPVAFDCENFQDPDSRQYHLTKKDRTDLALVFLETVEDLGYEGMFYASKNDMQQDAKWEVSRIQKDYKIWVAQYPDPPYPQTPVSSYGGEYQMWQYSMDGSVPGIGESVDLDIAYFAYDGIEPAKNPEPPQEAEPDPEALMAFEDVSEVVTAKESTRLRSIPSQGEDSRILFTLENGQTAHRIAVSPSGWSKVLYSDTVCYAVTSYLTTDLDGTGSTDADPDGDGIKTQFEPMDDYVTAKEAVNLRTLPSVEREDSAAITKLLNGQVVRRTGINRDLGWSRLDYQGRTCYAITSYLTEAEAPEPTEPADVGMDFEPVNEKVRAIKAVNLRTLPSTNNPDVEVMGQLSAGDTVLRTGVNRKLEWSRVEVNGQVLYCVSWYLEKAE